MNLLTIEIANMIAEGCDSGFEFKANGTVVELWFQDLDRHQTSDEAELYATFPIKDGDEENATRLHNAIQMALFAAFGFVTMLLLREKLNPADLTHLPIPAGVYMGEHDDWECAPYPFWAPKHKGPLDGTTVKVYGEEFPVVERRTINGHEFATYLAHGWTSRGPDQYNRILKIVHVESGIDATGSKPLNEAYERIEQTPKEKLDELVATTKARMEERKVTER